MAQDLELAQLQEIHDCLITLAKEAGDMITRAKPSTGTVDTKKNCKTSLISHFPLFIDNLSFTQIRFRKIAMSCYVVDAVSILACPIMSECRESATSPFVSERQN
jgi:hypothetical protein